MDPENETGAGADTGDAGAMGLEDALSASLAELDKSTTTAAASTGGEGGETTKGSANAAAAAGEGAAAQTGADRGDGRDAAGRFARKQGETDADFEKRKAAATGAAGADDAAGKAAAAAAKPGKDAAQQTADAAAAAAAAAQPQSELVDGRDISKAPSSWKPEAAIEFGKLPKVMRAEIHRREEAMFKGIEQYKGAAQFGTEIAKVTHPYQQMFTALKVTPADLMSAAVQFEYGIRTAKTPEAKLAILTNLAKSYGVALGAAPADGDGKGGAQPQLDPTIAALEGTVRQLSDKVTARERAEQEDRDRTDKEEREAVQKEITEFFADAKNEFASIVKEDVLAFVRQGLDLKPAYDKAIWANPVTRGTLIARQQEAERKEAAEKAAAANRANVVNVTPRATPQGKTAGKGTLDDALRDSLKELEARSA